MNNHCLRAVESRVDFGLTTHQIEEHPDYDDMTLFYISFNCIYIDAVSKFQQTNILKYFSYFFQKTGFDTSCKLSP